MLKRVATRLENTPPLEALHQYVSSGDLPAVQCLVHYHDTSALKEDREMDDTPLLQQTSKRYKNTALHYALMYNQQNDLLSYILHHLTTATTTSHTIANNASQNSTINQRNSKGYTPLFLAVMHCTGSTAVRKLLQHGADHTMEIYRKDGTNKRSLLDIAKDVDNYDAIRILQELPLFVAQGQQQQQQQQKHEDEIYGKKNNSTTSVQSQKYVQYDTKIPPATAKKQENVCTKKKAKCPICQTIVKYPSKMHYLQYYHKHEKQPKQSLPDNENNRNNNKNYRHQHHIHPFHLQESNNYLNKFLSSPAFTTLCDVTYHGVNNKSDIRKEVTESWSIYEAVLNICKELQVQKEEEELIFIDLCSGKALTTALLSILYPKSKCVAVDILPSHAVPHFVSLPTSSVSCSDESSFVDSIVNGGSSSSKNNDVSTNATACEKNAEYWIQDIMRESFERELTAELSSLSFKDEASEKSQTTAAITKTTGKKRRQKIPILVGMHLCGNLSLRAIELFQKLTCIRAIVLAPCCLPKRRRKKKKTMNGGSVDDLDGSTENDFYASVQNKESVGVDRASHQTRKKMNDIMIKDEWYMYNQWSKFLYEKLQCTGTKPKKGSENVDDESADTDLETFWYVDRDIHSKKNCIITCIRK